MIKVEFECPLGTMEVFFQELLSRLKYLWAG
jgi:hypothetical protein